MRRRVMVKSSDRRSDLVSGQTSKQYNSRGRHLLFTSDYGRSAALLDSCLSVTIFSKVHTLVLFVGCVVQHLRMQRTCDLMLSAVYEICLRDWTVSASVPTLRYV